MEIITGIERRRRWSAEEKLRIVAETERADGGIAEIAHRYEISRGLLWNWQSQVRRGALRAEPPALVLSSLEGRRSQSCMAVSVVCASPARRKGRRVPWPDPQRRSATRLMGWVAIRSRTWRRRRRCGHVRRDNRAILRCQALIHDTQHHLEGRGALPSSAIADFQRLEFGIPGFRPDPGR
jgi:transposase-like protein